MSDDPLYREICASIRTTDDISFKLLGFVPLVSGAGIVAALLGSDVLWSPAIYLISLLGAGITFGFFRWELKNIMICNWLIHCAQAVEYRALTEGDEVTAREDERVGQFYRRPEPPGLYPEREPLDRPPKESPKLHATSAGKGIVLPAARAFAALLVRNFVERSFGKTESEKLVYSLVIFSWLNLPWIVGLSSSEGLIALFRGWALVLTVLYLLLATFLGILTLFALRAKVTDVGPMDASDAEKWVDFLVAKPGADSGAYRRARTPEARAPIRRGESAREGTSSSA